MQARLVVCIQVFVSALRCCGPAHPAETPAEGTAGPHPTQLHHQQHAAGEEERQCVFSFLFISLLIFVRFRFLVLGFCFVFVTVLCTKFPHGEVDYLLWEQQAATRAVLCFLCCAHMCLSLCVCQIVYLWISVPRYPYTYQMRTGEVKPNLVDYLESDAKLISTPKVNSLPFPGDGVLHPAQTVALPVWLRGNDIGGVHEVDFLFYYEPVAPRTQVK